MAISLGPLPRPTDDADLTTRLKDALKASAGSTTTGLDGARVTATLSDPDISLLDVDLSGVTIPALDLRGSGRGPLVSGVDITPDAGTGTPGVLRELKVGATPLDIAGAPVTLSAAFADLPITWSESGGTCLLEIDEPSPGHPVVGTAHLEVPVTGLEVAAKQALTDAARDMATIKSVDLTVTSPRPNTLAVNVAAQAKKSLFSAVIMATATVTIDRSMVATLSGVTLNSPNAVFAAALRLMSAKVAALEGRRIELNTLVPGLHATDLQVTGGQTVTVDATFG